MSIASDDFLHQPFSVQCVEVEAAKPFLGENGEANSMHLIDHAPAVTAIVTLTNDGNFTLLVLVLNRFLKPNQLPKKESLVRACEKQEKKPKKRGCAISGKSTLLIHLQCYIRYLNCFKFKIATTLKINGKTYLGFINKPP